MLKATFWNKGRYFYMAIAGKENKSDHKVDGVASQVMIANGREENKRS